MPNSDDDLATRIAGLSLTRRRLMQSFAAAVAPAMLATTARAAQAPAAGLQPLSPDVLPRGVRSRFVNNINGIRIHVLEAGFDAGTRPCVLLLHGFPELAYSWRQVMMPL